jgi:hypothetical protein
MSNITGEVTQKLVEAFEFFNKELDANLDTPVFTLIPNRGRQSYYGWYWADRWKDGKKTLPEINITADTLKRSVEEICETIIHEMAHYKNNVNGIQDCNANQYHNKAFKKQAEAFGLKVERMRNKGYAKTELSEKANNLVKKYKNKFCKDDKNPFHVYRVGEFKSTVVKMSTKRFIAVDKDLAEEIEQVYASQTLRATVEDLMRQALRVQELV